MATRKHPQFEFGGVDSRSNPVNFPANRALRCLNWAPQANGALRLRAGYTEPMQATNDTVGATTIHSLLYYEQFSASYLGPQFVLYGKGANIEQYNLSGGASVKIGTFTTSNPWGHFRSKNRIFLSDGTTQYNWDGTNLRVSGLPDTDALSAPESLYAGAALGGGWTNPGFAVGPPDSNTATASSTGAAGTAPLQLTNYGFSAPTSSQILGGMITVVGGVQVPGHIVQPNEQLSVAFIYQGAIIGQVKNIAFVSGAGVPLNQPHPIGSSSDSWMAGLTPAIVNDPTFGVEIQGVPPGGTDTATWYIDAVQITLTFTGVTQVLVSVVGSSIGSIAPTTLTGYQLFLSVYDTVTQHMGNRGMIGAPVAVGATQSAFLLQNLPDPRALATGLNVPSSELVLAVGITQDGLGIPYWMTDAQGNPIVISGGVSSFTIPIGLSDGSQELPINNNQPPPLDKFARVGTRIFGNLSGSPEIFYSNDESDVSNADYVGNPEESWPPNQATPLPTGEAPTCIHGWRLEGWFLSRNNLCIWSNFLLQQGVNPWRGPYPGGAVGQRAFIETPYGPFWLGPQKQLYTFMEDGVISVSEEYEAALLGQIAEANLGSVELSYLLSADKLVDQIVIKGIDKNGNDVIVIHDFRLKDARSEHGQGYSASYVGLTVQTFAGAGYTPRQNVYDTSAEMRLWAGSQEGFIAQLEDGTNDNGQNFTGDYIGLIPLGPNRPGLVSVEIQGDGNTQVSWSKDYSDGSVDDWQVSPAELIPGETSVWEYKMTGEARWLYVRMQLSSDDANYAFTDPPFVPIPTTGFINQATLKLGTDRPEAV